LQIDVTTEYKLLAVARLTVFRCHVARNCRLGVTIINQSINQSSFINGRTERKPI